MTTKQNLAFSEGESWVIFASLTGRDGEPLDVTDAVSIQWTIAKRKDAEAVFTAGVGNGLITVTDSEAGEIEIVVDPADHTDVTVGSWLHECRVILDDGDTSIQFKGKFICVDSLFVVP